MIGNIFVQSWLIWATFHTTGEHFFHQKFPLLSSGLKNVLTDFLMQPFANVLQISCYCYYRTNGLQLYLKKETPTPVFSCECLKIFYETPQVAASENGFEEFLKAVLHGTICMIWARKLRNRGNFLHWNVDETILKRSDDFRFVWNED